MESKSRTFSLYLLNEGVEPQDALADKSALSQETADSIPSGAILYLVNSNAHDPWWKGYLGVSKKLEQSYPGGILFIPVGCRWLAATFGQSHHYLSPSSYEYDFGLKTTLNAVNRDSIRSTDAVNPETAKRERIQSPKEADIRFFSFDGDNNIILKRMTGRVQAQYADLLSSVTGCDSIRVTTKKSANELVELCQNLLGLFAKDEAATKFPEVFNVRYEKTPSIVTQLDNFLVDAIKEKDSSLILSYPEILDYQNIGQVQFGRLKPVDLFTIESFWKAIPENELNEMSHERLQAHYNVGVLDADGKLSNRTRPSLYKCLIYEHELNGETYHFCEGKWYRVDQHFINDLTKRLNPYFLESKLPDNKMHCEADYNKMVAATQGHSIVFDRKTLFISGQTPIELCDICQLDAVGEVALIHVKIGVHSSNLSHLFAQGHVGSEILLVPQSGAIEHFSKIVSESPLDDSSKDSIIKKVRERRFNVVFAIITKKSASLKSDALPLFSRINLRRVIDSLETMNIKPSVQIIADAYDGRNSK